MTKRSIAETLKKQRVLIFNSRKPEIASKINIYGADSVYIDKGEGLYNEVIHLTENQKKEQQEESLAYDNYYEAKSYSVMKFKINRKIIKMASRADKNLQDRLKVYARRERNIEEWIQQSIEFYNLVLNEPEFLTSIAKYGITSEKLNQEKQELDFLRSLRNEAMSEKGQSQEATRLRNNKMEELEDYCYELKTIATIALEDNSQLLEALGVIVRN